MKFYADPLLVQTAAY